MGETIEELYMVTFSDDNGIENIAVITDPDTKRQSDYVCSDIKYMQEVRMFLKERIPGTEFRIKHFKAEGYVDE